MTSHLLIFARHPELGRVKTRLAAAIGPEAALAVYRELLAHTRAATEQLQVHKTVWLAEPPATPSATPDLWAGYEQQLQLPGDLGTKMQMAFSHAFANGARAAIIIGTDCPGLTAALVQEAFVALATHEVVIGPAEDGGYYLLGMKEVCTDLFLRKSWSTNSVLPHTLADADRLGLQVKQLPMLRDVDDATDLAAWRAATER
ncbi:TIGR04282 family arsenosugar biosynthesis glycosyltransferase [Microvirga sp. STR05]|uniref:TIGR04282 family arsenosugar biosynthesis glycosyltransferase n=1 Tax=Hymenobacter duratus TaxID=2771356 RepID=A0ABR8JNQ3_9BACT|nr:TIGR04282 family arsenosugar biosynthesis glycosyltransferase [Hymenobacter duratus]MBD2717017.1 TIGR04282 family arsenosugar biosynthesis glycosyltransferase [Hymenobacter duratus]MBR7951933.1 TIGR04282 family arsenosugar biosynthesis glycosyltransferase [Microvirga sp. STR05]